MLNLVIFGPPGSGKGTQAIYIREKYALTHLSTGELLRKEISLKTKLGEEIQDLVSNGKLVSDEIVTEVLKKSLTDNLDQGNGFIFDGFPRNKEQAQILENVLKSINLKLTVAINLNVSEPELIKRLLLRGQTSGRTDDNESVIKERLEIYQEHASGLISFYKNKNLLLEINGEGTQKNIFQNIVSKLEGFF